MSACPLFKDSDDQSDPISLNTQWSCSRIYEEHFTVQNANARGDDYRYLDYVCSSSRPRATPYRALSCSLNFCFGRWEGERSRQICKRDIYVEVQKERGIVGSVQRYRRMHAIRHHGPRNRQNGYTLPDV
jgi:hypothetical protein